MPRKNRTASPAPVVPQALTDFQETVCNLAADLILNGGAEADVANLLRATIGHSLNLRFPECGCYSEDRIKLDLPEWLKMLSRYWPAKTQRKHPLPTTVSEMVRANLRGNLGEKFDEFMSAARMHELYLMLEVLDSFDSITGGPDDEAAESVLAEAFMRQIESDHTYVKVLSDRVHLVEDFLETIDSIPDDAPVAAGRPKLLVFPARKPREEEHHAS
jgi:hypothetical protein